MKKQSTIAAQRRTLRGMMDSGVLNNEQQSAAYIAECVLLWTETRCSWTPASLVNELYAKK